MDNLSTLQQEIPDEAALKEAEIHPGLQKLTALLKKACLQGRRRFHEVLLSIPLLCFGISQGKEAVSEQGRDRQSCSRDQ